MIQIIRSKIYKMELYYQEKLLIMLRLKIKDNNGY